MICKTCDVPTLRDQLRRDRLLLEENFLQHGKAATLLVAHSRLIDRHLRCIWQQMSMPEDTTLIAVGGYGRGELYPKSDIDLLILLSVDADDVLQHKLHELLAMLWDIGLEVGHSIRTVAQCVDESVDITVQTNLLEARRLCGNAELFEKLRQSVQQHIDPKAFFTAKQQEQQQRHKRFDDTDFNLEPNLKESPGGLRDLQTITWISRAAGLGTDWRELADAGLLSQSEARSIARHDALLQTLRCRLHYLAHRREDRLLFEFQTPLAGQMGISASDNRRASEHLMQRYYRTKLAVRQYNTILLQNLHDFLFRDTPPVVILNERFHTIGNLLEIRTDNLFEQQPETIFELFLIMQQHPELVDLTAKTLRALWRAQVKIDAAFRRDLQNRARFMEILRQPQGVIYALRHMRQYGILGRYLPAFGRITGQMQHDLFHVYTVDEHILMVVRNLRRFNLAQHAAELPLCSKLMSEFARPEVLYIAGLFHDIAKGRGGDHAQKGKKDARLFCTHHQLGKSDSDLIVWLVEQHLTLSATAQKQDLSDPDVIGAFTEKIKNDRYLVALYLLTVADVKGTSPKVWNVWKAKLMEDLFLLSRRYMKEGATGNYLHEIREQAAATLNLYAMNPESYRLLWAQLEDSYFLDHEAQEIAWHSRQLAFRVNTVPPVVKTRLSRGGTGLQVLVYCPEQRGLFARICAFFSRLHYTIVEAKIHSTHHGYALNSFQIMEITRSEMNYRDLMNYIEFELTEKIVQARPLENVSNGRVNRQLKHFPIQTRINFEKDKRGMYVLSLIAGDRPGLLSKIAQIFNHHNIQLHRAKINTLGSRAEDVFWVSGTILDNPVESSMFLNDLLEKI
jgi:[protein-PII] uridylyltransferase